MLALSSKDHIFRSFLDVQAITLTPPLPSLGNLGSNLHIFFQLSVLSVCYMLGLVPSVPRWIGRSGSTAKLGLLSVLEKHTRY